MKIKIDITAFPAFALVWIIYCIMIFICIFGIGCAPQHARVKSDFYLKKVNEVGAAGQDGRFSIMACDNQNRCYFLGSGVEVQR